uniref:Uncharacterized protein n=1 Tax=Candidatus Kentrum sp. LFY TaxID=2126342 RepID=A0A450UGW0_9GAMM|nr:MAG: hypothetical protein BECKLFY1418A_GA0070994_101810 [Candidatus Kentron sp. LFY]VFJ98781.1 MAG: hypothetical protein BECKLFY1418B_GA0070995_11287 [Candidatus Kentron sp. LFY]
MNMLALRAKAETGWVLAYPAVLSGFLFFRYLNKLNKLVIGIVAFMTRNTIL